MRKIFYILPLWTGIIINITPQNEETKKENNKSRKSIIVFKSPIANSPANWTFSGSGDKYDVTLIFLMNRKASRIKDQLQERSKNAQILNKIKFTKYLFVSRVSRYKEKKKKL